MTSKTATVTFNGDDTALYTVLAGTIQPGGTVLNCLDGGASPPQAISDVDLMITFLSNFYITSIVCDWFTGQTDPNGPSFRVQMQSLGGGPNLYDNTISPSDAASGWHTSLSLYSGGIAAIGGIRITMRGADGATIHNKLGTIVVTYNTAVPITPTWSDFMMSEQKPAVSFEDVYKFYAAKAGIHQVNFTDRVGQLLANYNQWTLPTNLTWQAGAFVATGMVGSGYPIYQQPLPHSYTIEQWLNEGEDYRVYLRADSPTSAPTNYFDVWFKNPGNGGHLLQGSLTFTNNFAGTGGSSPRFKTYNLTDVELYQFHGLLKIVVYEGQYDLIDQTEVSIRVYMNDRLIGFCCIPNMPIVSTNNYLAIPVWSTGKLRIGMLGEPCQFSSADPDGTFQSAIDLAMQDKYVKCFTRYDGSLKAIVPWAKIPNSSLVSWWPTWDDDDIHEMDGIPALLNNHFYAGVSGATFSYKMADQVSINVPTIVTHVRVLGAISWAQSMDIVLLRKFGHRFREINNSSVFSADATKIEADLFLKRIYEQAFTYQLRLYGMYFAEPEDLVILPGLNSITGGQSYWWIDTIQWDSDEAGDIVTTLNLRMYGQYGQTYLLENIFQ